MAATVETIAAEKSAVLQREAEAIEREAVPSTQQPPTKKRVLRPAAPSPSRGTYQTR